MREQTPAPGALKAQGGFELLDRYRNNVLTTVSSINDVALKRIGGALQFLLRDGPPTATTLTGRVYRAGVKPVDYDVLALQVGLATEAANPSLHSA